MAAFKEYGNYDALGLAELIARKKITAGEALDAAIERIEALNPRINAVVQKMYDEGRQTLKNGLPTSPLAGRAVPSQGPLHLVCGLARRQWLPPI